MIKHTLDTAPTVEPITVAEVKTNLGITDTESDSVIPDYIKAARRWAEDYTWKAFITQTWTMTLDNFPDAIELVKRPVQSVTAIQYYDIDANLQALSSANYFLDNKGDLSRHYIVPAYGVSWPSTLSRINAVDVTYVAGFGDAGSDVPEDIRRALHIIVRSWLHSEGERGIYTPTMPRAAITLLDSYRDVRL